LYHLLVERRKRMKWYVLTFFLLVGFVWNASAQPAQPAQPIDPKLVGEWETTDGPCDPCTLSIQASGKVTYTLANSPIEVLYARGTPDPGIDVMLARWGKLDLSLTKSGFLVGFYTDDMRPIRNHTVLFRRK
jgi:hypothetical protein